MQREGVNHAYMEVADLLNTIHNPAQYNSPMSQFTHDNCIIAFKHSTVQTKRGPFSLAVKAVYRKGGRVARVTVD